MRNVVRILLLAFLLVPAVASTQTRRPAPVPSGGPVLTGDLISDAKNGFKGDPNNPSAGVKLTGNIEKDALAIWQKIVAASNTDLTYASALANSANTSASKIRKQCWDAILALNEQANGMNLKNPDGTVMAKPDPSLFTDVETLAEVIDNLSPQGPLFTSCAGAAQLAKTNVLSFINGAVTGAAGIAAMPVIPGL